MLTRGEGENMKEDDVQVIGEVVMAGIVDGLQSLNSSQLEEVISLAREELFSVKMTELTKELDRLSQFRPDTEKESLIKEKLLAAQEVLQEIMDKEK